MRTIDRYILREMIGPFLFGIGAFIIVLVSVNLLYQALRLIIEQGHPVALVVRAFLYQIPQTVTLTLPMATIFGSLMAIGRLSGDGEVEAMRAGGVSFLRLARPVLVAGLAISGFSLVLNEYIVPPANAASNQILADLAHSEITQQDYLVLPLPDNQRPRIWLYADHFAPKSGRLEKLTIIEFRAGVLHDYYTAQDALWQGTTIFLNGVTQWIYSPDGTRTSITLDHLAYAVTKAPWQVAGFRQDPDNMTAAELRQEIRRTRQLPATARQGLTVLEAYYYNHLALPWAAFGFALIGAPLGLRPARATTGIGLGLSLVIIFAYYIMFHTMNIIGEHGGVSPLVSAWVPNLVLYATGLGLFFGVSQ